MLPVLCHVGESWVISRCYYTDPATVALIRNNISLHDWKITEPGVTYRDHWSRIAVSQYCTWLHVCSNVVYSRKVYVYPNKRTVHCGVVCKRYIDKDELHFSQFAEHVRFTPALPNNVLPLPQGVARLIQCFVLVLPSISGAIT